MSTSPDNDSTGESQSYDFSVLRDLRKDHNLTMSQVKELSGVSIAVISKLERNHTRAELETLYRLARVFGLTAAELLNLAETRTAQRAVEKPYHSNGFDFRKVDYANVQCFHAKATKNTHLSRPDAHGNDLEVCWVLSGTVRIGLPRETHVLNKGEALQFDAVQSHTYEALEDCEILILHIRKDKRF